VGGRVDAAGETGHDGGPCRREIPGHGPGQGAARRRRRARTDDRHAPLRILRFEPAAHVQDRRRIEDPRDQGREVRFVTGHDTDAEGGGAAALFVRPALRRPLAAEQGESLGGEQFRVGVGVGQHVRDRPEVEELPHRRRGEAGK
jgi:hypothetical protein